MMRNQESEPVVNRIGEFEVHWHTGELTGAEGPSVRLNEKPLLLLKALARKPGEVITREALHGELWPDDTHVDYDNNLNAAVKKVRDAFGDEAASPRYVETIPRKGYRLVAEVSLVEKEVARKTSPKSGSFRWMPALVIAIAIALVWALGPTWRDKGAKTPAETNDKIMLVVMPFANLSGDAINEPIADGLTEELIAHLGRLDPDKLGVISRISSMAYKNTNKQADEIGRELEVDYLLEGSLRREGDRWRITVQLIETSDQTHRWSENYEVYLVEALDMQRDVSLQVAREMTLELLESDIGALVRSFTDDTEAYRAYLYGRDSWFRFTNEGYRGAISYFEYALKRDPNFVPAHAGLADAYNMATFSDFLTVDEAFAKAKQHAREAIRLDARYAPAHNSLAFALLYHERDYAGAERSFDRALELSPGYAMAYHWQAALLSVQGRHDEAIAAVEQAMTLDPVNLGLVSDLGWYYLFADRPEAAIAAFEHTLSLSAGYDWAIAGMSLTHHLLGNRQEAWQWQRKDMILDGYPREIVARLDQLPTAEAYQEALLLRYSDAEKKNADADHIYAKPMVFICAALGKYDEAFGWLEKMFADQDGWVIFLEVDPRFDPLRHDPRFQTYRVKAGLAPGSIADL